jgi:hypothetical protein
MHFVFSKQWGKLDYRVWMSLIALSLISLTVFGYKVATNEQCPSVNIALECNLNHAGLDSNTFYVNEEITFNTHTTAPDQHISWDFGDKTPLHIGSKILHAYNKEGRYLATVTIKGKCAQSVVVKVIKNSISLFDSTVLDINPIISADIIKLGNETIFNTSTVAKEYTWGIEELPDIGVRNTPTARFIFPKPGNFTITLTLDNGKVFKKVIQIVDPFGQADNTDPLPPVKKVDLPELPPPAEEPLPLPPVKKEEPVVKDEPAAASKPPASKTYDQLPTPAIQVLLEGVVAGKKDIDDFKNILCNGAGTKVMANNEATTFAALVNELKEKKGLPLMKRKRKISSVKVVRDEANGNCVKILYVDYK